MVVGGFRWFYVVLGGCMWFQMVVYGFRWLWALRFKCWYSK